TEHENTFAARGRTVLEDMLGELPKHEPKFSVITVCRNAEKTIERTIRSVIAQTYPNKEFVVVDGASKDGTLGIIEKYREQIDVFVSEPDKGIYDAMNKAVSLATGDYVIFINADDYLYDENVLRRASEVPEADFLFGGQYDLCPDGKLLPAKNLDGLDAYHLFRGFFAHQTIFAKRNLWERFGDFDQNYKICADRDWLCRCFVSGKMTTAKIDSVVAVYAVGGFSDTQRNLHNLERTSLLERNLGRTRLEHALLRFEKIFRNGLLKTKLHGVLIDLMKKRFQKKYPSRAL
ncbi:MAG: glycosyltransferase family 2 protein, partial [Candidatus Spyradosoma sp.]